MALDHKYQGGQTPLDPDEVAGLIPAHLTDQSQLDEWEQENILGAVRWLAASRNTDVLTEGFCRELHRRMFNRTWKWAGQFRQSNKNIGCDWPQIAARLSQLLENTQFWFAKDVFPVDEAAARFHVQLVSVHAFPNGNGRHARLMTDRLLRQVGAASFSWGDHRDLGVAGNARQDYLTSLRAADKGDFSLLMNFARS
ncbi:MAG: mobile mystery protein B [Betaproteobacteria bacterium]